VRAYKRHSTLSLRLMLCVLLAITFLHISKWYILCLYSIVTWEHTCCEHPRLLFRQPFRLHRLTGGSLWFSCDCVCHRRASKSTREVSSPVEEHSEARQWFSCLLSYLLWVCVELEGTQCMLLSHLSQLTVTTLSCRKFVFWDSPELLHAKFLY